MKNKGADRGRNKKEGMNREERRGEAEEEEGREERGNRINRQMSASD